MTESQASRSHAVTSSTDHFLPAPTETGSLGVYQLKRLWARITTARSGKRFPGSDEGQLDRLVIHALGLGLEQTHQYLGSVGPTFDAFERWVVETAGPVEADQVARINALVSETEPPETTRRWLDSITEAEPVLSVADLAFWEKYGYVIVHDAVTPEGRAAAEGAIWEHLGASPDDPESWYRSRTNGIMVQFFQHPAFATNRRSCRIHKAFAQLWQTVDLWVSTDRCGFNVPEREGWMFPGPDLHWDVSLRRPIPFGTQGILYLTDTPPEQGALTLVPGFHHRLGDWLDSLPSDAEPRRQDLHALGSVPIGGRAGDLIIWHHALPHGSRPNRGLRPRLVQYIDMYPGRVPTQNEWK